MDSDPCNKSGSIKSCSSAPAGEGPGQIKVEEFNYEQGNEVLQISGSWDNFSRATAAAAAGVSGRPPSVAEASFCLFTIRSLLREEEEEGGVEEGDGDEVPLRILLQAPLSLLNSSLQA